MRARSRPASHHGQVHVTAPPPAPTNGQVGRRGAGWPDTLPRSASSRPRSLTFGPCGNWISIPFPSTLPFRGFNRRDGKRPHPVPRPQDPGAPALPSCQAPPEPRSQNPSLSCARGPRRLGTEPHETLATRLTLVLAAGAGLAGGWATPLRSWGDTRERGLGRGRPRGQDVTPWL